MAFKKFVLFLSVALTAGIVFLGVPLDNSIDLRVPSWIARDAGISSVNIQMPGWLVCQEAVASPYRRSVRRTARRTSRRVSRRHSAYRGGYYYGGAAVAAGAAVVGTAIAVGTVVTALPPACSTAVVNGVTYYNCSGTYYAPSGTRWIVVNAP